MDYKIEVKFSNIEKTGKMTLKDGKGKIVLNKVSITVPPNQGIFLTRKNLKEIDVFNQFDSNLLDEAQIEKKQEYEKICQYAKDNGIQKIIVDGSNNVVLIGMKKIDGKLKADKTAFVIESDSYELISSILLNNNLSLESEKISFLLGVEQVVLPHSDMTIIASSLKKNGVKNIVSNLENDKEKIKSKINFNNLGINEQVLSFETKQDVKPNPIKPEKPKKTMGGLLSRLFGGNSSNNFNKSSPAPQNSSNINDPMLNHFAYMNPDLAALYKPSSLMAFAVLFGGSLSSISKSEVVNNIKNVSGFENVDHVEMKYTESGYNVSLYQDETQEKLAGVLHFDNLNSVPHYALVSPEGYKTEITATNSSNWDTNITTQDGTSYNYPLEQSVNSQSSFSWGDSSQTENYGTNNATTNDVVPYYEQNNNSYFNSEPTPSYDNSSNNNSWSSGSDTSSNYNSGYGSSDSNSSSWSSDSSSNNSW